MDAGTIACPVLVYSRSREQCPIYEEYVVFWISVKSDAMPKHVLFLLILFLSADYFPFVPAVYLYFAVASVIFPLHIFSALFSSDLIPLYTVR